MAMHVTDHQAKRGMWLTCRCLILRLLQPGHPMCSVNPAGFISPSGIVGPRPLEAMRWLTPYDASVTFSFQV